ncbi:unnamed protein product [Meloidogyne enterolobii]|uniref:Uncharacterized protein n=1 Tax=Meloidogyne enterolobii TaxID=390850 RepID=A0ACB0ZCX1_MELEN
MHSWIDPDASESDLDASFDERISDAIPSTCGGRRRSGVKSNATNNKSTQNNISPFLTPPRPERQAVQQNQPKLQSSRSRHTHDPNTTPLATRQSEKSRSNLVAARRSAQSPASIYSEDESIRQHRLKIQNHPKPGNGATKLQQLVNLPFRAVFGRGSRVASSREVEVQRAGSSFKPMSTPFDKGFEAELPLHDSPEIDRFPNGVNRSQQTLNGLQQREYQQTEITAQQQTNTFQREFSQNIPLRHDKENQTDDIQIAADSPISDKFKKQNKNYIFHNNRLHSPFQNSLLSNKYGPSSTLRYYRPYSLQPPIAVTPKPEHYRRLHLDHLAKRIREGELKRVQLSAQFKLFNESTRQDLEEWELLNNQLKLDARRRNFEQNLREQEERERNTTTNNSLSTRPVAARPLTPAPILRKTPIPKTNVPRVSFTSPPIRSPNRNVVRSQSQRPPENPDTRKAKKYIENRGIEEEDRRVNYVIKWNSNQEQLRKAKRANPRINLKSNPTSVFQYIPGNSSTRR